MNAAPKVINVGWPKIGSTRSCMARAIKNNMPPLSTCGSYGAYTQMDMTEKEGCYFPQISYLNEIYDEEPSAILILPFRNISEWISSVSRYHDMRNRMINVCEFPEYSFALGMGAKDEELEDLYCQHVKHIRKFVAERPSLTLIEYSIGADGVGDYPTKWVKNAIEIRDRWKREGYGTFLPTMS